MTNKQNTPNKEWGSSEPLYQSKGLKLSHTLQEGRITRLTPSHNNELKKLLVALLSISLFVVAGAVFGSGGSIMISLVLTAAAITLGFQSELMRKRVKLITFVCDERLIYGFTKKIKFSEVKDIEVLQKVSKPTIKAETKEIRLITRTDEKFSLMEGVDSKQLALIASKLSQIIGLNHH